MIVDLKEFEYKKLKEENEMLKKCLLLHHSYALSNDKSSYLDSVLYFKVMNLLKRKIDVQEKSEE